MKKILRILVLTFVVCTMMALLGGLSSSAMTEDGKIVVVIDPGHGGKDPGTCEGNQPEAHYTLKVAQYCKAALEANGNFEVYLTRDDADTSLTLLERGLIANEKNADILISCHFDGMTDTSLRGVEAYVSVVDTYAKVDLGRDIVNRLSDASGMPIFRQGVFQIKDHGDTLYYWDKDLNWSIPNDPSRGPLRDYYGVIKWSAYFGIPSMIIEHGFLSNASDRALIENEATVKALGEADAAALIAYYTGHTHQFGEQQRDFPSNCMVQGKDSSRCSICSARKDVTLRPADADAHIWLESAKVKGSCETDGYTEYTCEVTRAMNIGKEGYCDLHTYKEEKKAPGHKYSVTEKEDSIHGKDGFVKYACSSCEKSYTEVLEGDPHTYIFTKTVAPTCTEKGYDLHTCSQCDVVKREKQVDATGHLEEIASETPPDCLSAGMRTHRCTVCKAERSEELPPLGHSLKDPTVVEGSCTQDASRSGNCERCGESVTEITKEAPGHTLPAESEWQVTVADCETPGYRSYVCLSCGESIREETDAAIGHAYIVSDEVAAGCETDGYREHRCEHCSHSYRDTLPMMGHTYEPESETDPSCEIGGSRTNLCQTCGHQTTETLPATGHDFVEDSEGKRVCQICKEVEDLATSVPEETPPDTPDGGFVGWLKENPVRLALLFAAFVLLIGLIVVFLTSRRVFTFAKTVAAEERDAEVWDKAETEAVIAEAAAEVSAAVAEETAAETESADSEKTNENPESPDVESEI